MFRFAILVGRLANGRNERSCRRRRRRRRNVSYTQSSVLRQKTLLIRVVEIRKVIPWDIVVHRVSSEITPDIKIPAFLKVIHAARQRQSEGSFANARGSNENQTFGTFGPGDDEAIDSWLRLKTRRQGAHMSINVVSKMIRTKLRSTFGKGIWPNIFLVDVAGAIGFLLCSQLNVSE